MAAQTALASNRALHARLTIVVLLGNLIVPGALHMLSIRSAPRAEKHHPVRTLGFVFGLLILRGLVFSSVRALALFRFTLDQFKVPLCCADVDR